MFGISGTDTNSIWGWRFEDFVFKSKTRKVWSKFTAVLDLTRSQFLKKIRFTVFNLIFGERLSEKIHVQEKILFLEVLYKFGLDGLINMINY